MKFNSIVEQWNVPLQNDQRNFPPIETAMKFNTSSIRFKNFVSKDNIFSTSAPIPNLNPKNDTETR